MGGEEGAGVGADADEQRVAEGHEAGMAEEEVEPEEHHRVGHERQHEEDVVGGRHPWQAERGERHRRQHGASPHAALPKSPRGRRRRTTITMR